MKCKSCEQGLTLWSRFSLLGDLSNFSAKVLFFFFKPSMWFWRKFINLFCCWTVDSYFISFCLYSVSAFVRWLCNSETFLCKDWSKRRREKIIYIIKQHSGIGYKKEIWKALIMQPGEGRWCLLIVWTQFQASPCYVNWTVSFWWAINEILPSETIFWTIPLFSRNLTEEKLHSNPAKILCHCPIR